MSDGGEHRIPVLVGVALQNLINIFRLVQLGEINALCPAVPVNHIPAPLDIVRAELCLEPLVDLVLRLGRADELQPVTAGSPGVLGGDNLHPVAVLDDIVDIDQLSVDAGAHHLVAHRAVDGVGEIDGGGSAGKILHVSRRCKAVYAVLEQIQIAL